ncbi:MAG TPA: competence protein CoiA family protein [Lactobacillaceae bacterium]|jgi:competence protein CoiA
MFIAKYRETYVRADEAKRGNIGYTCPGCGATVTLKRGQIMQAHFAHGAGSECAQFSEAETADHLQGKLALAQLFAAKGSIQIEAVLGQTQQRPDILLTRHDGSRCAIEYQCSPISVQKLQARTDGYLRQNVDVVWVIGQPYLIKKLQQATLMKFLQRGQVWFYDVRQAKFSRWRAFYKPDFGQIRFEKRDIQLEKAVLKTQQLFVQQRVEPKFVTDFYQTFGQSPVLGPLWLHMGQTFGLKVGNWEWRANFLMLMQVRRRWLIRDLVAELASERFFYPSLDAEYASRQVREMLVSAIKNQLVLVDGNQLVARQISFYGQLTEKLGAARHLQLSGKVLE